jgi:2-oxoisovalerate ferredoxin oxidoreductase alpha subunit
MAARYRNPVYVLADGVLGQMVEPLNFPKQAIAPRPDVSWAVCGNAETRGNLITSIMLDFQQLEAMNVRLQEKYARIEAEEQDYEGYRLEDASIILVAYGISARIARSAVDTARSEGIAAGLFRPRTLFPFPRKALRELSKSMSGGGFLSVELSNGQMRDDIALAVECRRPVGLVNRMGGSLLTLDEVMESIRQSARDLKG